MQDHPGLILLVKRNFHLLPAHYQKNACPFFGSTEAFLCFSCHQKDNKKPSFSFSGCLRRKLADPMESLLTRVLLQSTIPLINHCYQ
jgi:hypothetical protein